MKAVSWENFKNRYDRNKKEERHYKKRKGYDSGNAPYRKSDSGLRWEGGNIYGANAKRGRRRSFLGRR